MAMITVKKVFPLKAGESADRLSSYQVLPKASEIKCLSPNGEAEIPFRFETGDLLWVSTDSIITRKVCYSYETKNLYYGSPLTGAILICNFMDLTELGPEDTDKFAEFLACYSEWGFDIKKFKLRPRRNLLAALLEKSVSDYDDTLKRLEKSFYSITLLINPLRYFLEELLENTERSEPNKVLISRIEMIDKYYSTLEDNRDVAVNALAFENVLTLAQRYPGLVEVKGDNYSFSEESSSFFKDNYGIDLKEGYKTIEPVALKENAKPDRFLKRALLLQKWCRDCK